MKFLCSLDVYFDIEAENQEKALTKGWDFVRDNLPESFCTEGAEMYIEEEEKETESEITKNAL